MEEQVVTLPVIQLIIQLTWLECNEWQFILSIFTTDIPLQYNLVVQSL